MPNRERLFHGCTKRKFFWTLLFGAQPDFSPSRFCFSIHLLNLSLVVSLQPSPLQLVFHAVIRKSAAKKFAIAQLKRWAGTRAERWVVVLPANNAPRMGIAGRNKAKVTERNKRW